MERTSTPQAKVARCCKMQEPSPKCAKSNMGFGWIRDSGSQQSFDIASLVQPASKFNCSKSQRILVTSRDSFQIRTYSNYSRELTKTTRLFQVCNDKEIVVVHLDTSGKPIIWKNYAMHRYATTVSQRFTFHGVALGRSWKHPWHCSHHRYAMAIIYLSGWH